MHLQRRGRGPPDLHVARAYIVGTQNFEHKYEQPTNIKQQQCTLTNFVTQYCTGGTLLRGVSIQEVTAPQNAIKMIPDILTSIHFIPPADATAGRQAARGCGEDGVQAPRPAGGSGDEPPAGEQRTPRRSGTPSSQVAMADFRCSVIPTFLGGGNTQSFGFTC